MKRFQEYSRKWTAEIEREIWRLRIEDALRRQGRAYHVISVIIVFQNDTEMKDFLLDHVEPID